MGFSKEDQDEINDMHRSFDDAWFAELSRRGPLTERVIQESCTLSALRMHIEAFEKDHHGVDPKVVLFVDGRWASCRAAIVSVAGDAVVTIESLQPEA